MSIEYCLNILAYCKFLHEERDDRFCAKGEMTTSTDTQISFTTSHPIDVDMLTKSVLKYHRNDTAYGIRLLLD